MCTTNSTYATYSMVTDRLAGTTGTGLDQFIAFIYADNGLAGANSREQIAGGVTSAIGLDSLIVEAANATGAAADGRFTVSEVVAMNGWIRQNRLAEWTSLHGDDEPDAETGFHRIQNNGSNTQWRDQNLIDTVIDGVFHLGFEIRDGSFLNEDGDPNATLGQMAQWLTAFYTDRSTTGTGLDRITDRIIADGGLAANISYLDIAAGADAANALNAMILEGLGSTGGLADGWVSADDVVALNSWFRADAARLARFTDLHGDDECGYETGFHLVQGDGSNQAYFGKNLVNTVADGIYHIGFEIRDGRLLNEDGNANARVSDVASWLTYFLADPSDTGTGLDKIVDTIKTDAGLAAGTRADNINRGAAYANQLNHLLLDGIDATNAMADGWITTDDIKSINAWINADAGRKAKFVALHGDDESGVETGYHLVQNNGADTEYFGRNLVNTVADGIYHIGFEIEGTNILNEDGDANATLTDMAAWMNYFVTRNPMVYGTDDAETMTGTAGAEEIVGNGGDDTIDAGGGNDLIEAGWGCDSVDAGAGDDLVYGGSGDDALDGGDGSDTYRTGGLIDGEWYEWLGFDAYHDTGASGIDRIEVIATGNADVGLADFVASGIEVIDASGAAGTVRLVGDWTDETWDFSQTTFVGGNIVIDAAGGDDRVTGTAGNDRFVDDTGDDSFDGAGGSDTFGVTGNLAGGWSSFQGYDTYADSGSSGIDRIVATGADVDIGIAGIAGIEAIDGSAATGAVRIVADWQSNTIDLRGVTLTRIAGIETDWGDDTVYGSAGADNIMGEGGADTIVGGAGDDTLDGGTDADRIEGGTGNDVLIGGGSDDNLNGGEGSDTYQYAYTFSSGWQYATGYDTIADTGTVGTDTVRAIGADVDIGLKSFAQAASGIEVIDGSGATGVVRLLGDWSAASYHFGGVTFVGSNIVIDVGGGNDTVVGSAQSNTIVGGQGDDTLDGAGGADTYRVTGSLASGFTGFDRYTDTGVRGIDTILAVGAAVDIGVAALSGIEVIDGSAATGPVRVVGTYNADILDFSGVALKSVAAIDLLSGDDVFTATAADDTVYGGGGKDDLSGGNGNDRLEGNSDNDSLEGGAGNDTLVGGQGDDKVDGGDGSDAYLYSNTQAMGWSSFGGFDTIADTGATGTDTIRAIGSDVDIGLRGFSASASGIEIVDATGATGAVRLIGDTSADVLDFRGVTILGSNVVIDAGHGNDTVTGSAGGDVLLGSFGDDLLDGAEGGDTYRYTGTAAGGWNVFNGYDTVDDSGATGIDTIVALGAAAVDIGLKSLSGIERIDATGATGGARLLGDGTANSIDLRNTTLVGITGVETGYGADTVWGSAGADRISTGGDGDTVDAGAGDDTVSGGSGDDSLSGGSGNDNVDGGSGNDQLFGGAGNDTITGGAGSDAVDGGDGSDVYVVSGAAAGGSSSWGGYDSYADHGASGTDTLRAVGGAVDIGLRAFSTATTGIEVIDTTAATGLARIYGDTTADSLDFRGTTLIGTMVIDGYGGNDSIAGSSRADDIVGGGGADLLAGNGGADRLQGGSGNDALADYLGADSMVGGTGKDRFALAHNDGSTLDLWGGTLESGRDYTADVYTLVGTRGALNLNALVHDFEAGLDKIDLSQLRNAANGTMTMSDLVIDYSGGNARVGFAAGVHTQTNASVANAYLTLLNVSALTSSSFAMTTAQLPSGSPSIEPVLPLLAG